MSSHLSRQAADMEKCIAAARGGDREALGRLLEMCRKYLLLIANTELDSDIQAKVSPSDIVQDTFVEAGRGFLDFRGKTEGELLGWLRQILRNNVANVRRHFETEKREVEREVPLEELQPDTLLREAVKQIESPSKEALAHEQDEQLEQALCKLPVHYRQVLLLHTWDRLTFAQIAAKLGSTEDAVRKLWGRAVEELTKVVEENSGK